MEKSFGGSAMILLFEEYNQLAKDLLYSLRQTHDDVIPVCMHYDGTLPDDIFSPFKNLVFTSDEGEPLYFNKLPKLDNPIFTSVDNPPINSLTYEFAFIKA